eukprot:UN11986
MQQYCDLNQPFKAIEAMMKTNNYDLVIELFDKYDIETLLKDKNKYMVSFDLLNQLVCFFADLKEEATIKYIEWISVLLENINVKEMDVNVNVLSDTLNKVEYHLTRIPASKLQIKQVMRCI